MRVNPGSLLPDTALGLLEDGVVLGTGASSPWPGCTVYARHATRIAVSIRTRISKYTWKGRTESALTKPEEPERSNEDNLFLRLRKELPIPTVVHHDAGQPPD